MGQHRLALIDGVRGLAAMAVVLIHYPVFFFVFADGQPVPDWRDALPGRSFLWPFMDYGLHAVELFWVISGFIFTHVYLSKVSTGTWEFFMARVARLYPLHLLTLIFMALMIAWGYSRAESFVLPPNADLYHFALNLLFASAWGFEQGKSFNGVIWSVSVEIPVYAVFWLSRTLLARHGSLFAVAMMAAFGAIVLTGPPTFIFACGYFFFSGSAIALLRRDSGGATANKVVLASALLIISASGFASGGGILPVALGLDGAFCLVVFLVVELETHVAAWVKNIAAWLGDASYGLYLWHMPLSLLLKLTISSFADVSALALRGWFMVAHLMLVLAAARISFVWFERPARALLTRKLHTVRTAAARGAPKAWSDMRIGLMSVGRWRIVSDRSQLVGKSREPYWERTGDSTVGRK